MAAVYNCKEKQPVVVVVAHFFYYYFYDEATKRYPDAVCANFAFKVAIFAVQINHHKLHVLTSQMINDGLTRE